MVDVVNSNLLVINFLPAQREFIANTVCKGQRLGDPETIKRSLADPTMGEDPKPYEHVWSSACILYKVALVPKLRFLCVNSPIEKKKSIFTRSKSEINQA